MATDSAVNDMSLQQLLDGLTKAHRQDIQAFGGGHLNENNLLKPKEKASHQPWEGSQKPHIPMVPKSKLQRNKKNLSKARRDQMENTMINFSIGTVGTIPVSTKGQGNVPGQLGQDNREEQTQSSDKISQSSSGRKNTVLVEELKLPEMMLTKANYPGPGRTGYDEDFKQPGSSQSPPQLGWTKDDILRHHFIPGFQDAVTMKEQYNKFVDFESDILQKQDVIERKLLSGNKAVEYLEKKLHESLHTLPYNGPNFHRLQLYSSILDELIENSPTFGYTLNQIKQEYDEYFATLLDSQPSRHKALYNQVERLTQRGPTGSNLLQMEKDRVGDLEQEAKDMLELNEQLRAELKEEEELAAQPEPEPKPKVFLTREEPPLEMVDQVEELHATILERLDEMNELRRQLRTEYVPSTVCTHLEQCIKETEVEFQKLKSQKDFFDRNISEMEKELQGSIDAADTTDKDAKRVWKKVTAVKADSEGKIVLDDSDDEGEDESKWNWYIS